MARRTLYTRRMTRSALITADELLHINLPNKRTELVRGVLVVSEPPGYNHGYVVVRLASALDAYARAHELGDVLAGDSGFKLSSNPDTVRGPDVAFVGRTRVSTPR